MRSRYGVFDSKKLNYREHDSTHSKFRLTLLREPVEITWYYRELG